MHAWMSVAVASRHPALGHGLRDVQETARSCQRQLEKMNSGDQHPPPSPSIPTGDVDHVGAAEDPHAAKGVHNLNLDVGDEPTIADLLSNLLSEMKENNRLLRALGTSRDDAGGLAPTMTVLPVQGPLEVQDATQIDERHESAAAPDPATTAETEDELKLKEAMQEQTKGIAKAVVELGEDKAASLRQHIFASLLDPSAVSDLELNEDGSDVLVWFEEKPERLTRDKGRLTKRVWVDWSEVGQAQLPRDSIADRNLADYSDQWTLKPATNIQVRGWTICVKDTSTSSRFLKLPMHGTALFSCGGSSVNAIIRPGSRHTVRTLSQSGNVKGTVPRIFGSFGSASPRIVIILVGC